MLNAIKAQAWGLPKVSESGLSVAPPAPAPKARRRQWVRPTEMAEKTGLSRQTCRSWTEEAGLQSRTIKTAAGHDALQFLCSPGWVDEIKAWKNRPRNRIMEVTGRIVPGTWRTGREMAADLGVPYRLLQPRVSQTLIPSRPAGEGYASKTRAYLIPKDWEALFQLKVREPGSVAEPTPAPVKPQQLELKPLDPPVTLESLKKAEEPGPAPTPDRYEVLVSTLSRASYLYGEAKTQVLAWPKAERARIEREARADAKDRNRLQRAAEAAAA